MAPLKGGPGNCIEVTLVSLRSGLDSLSPLSLLLSVKKLPRLLNLMDGG